MSRNTELITSVDNIRPWARRDERAPHKPLLLLLALGRYSHGSDEWISYSEVAPLLRSLLIEFGPTRTSYHPEYPFWRLYIQDGLWEVQSDAELVPRRANSDPKVSELRQKNAAGRLPDWVREALDADAELLHVLVERILDQHFKPSLHSYIASAVGIELRATRGRRDPKFREEVLLAYEYQCAVCGHDIRFGVGPVIALEAAHIRMRQFRGPDSVNNGLALCSTHHTLFDFGAFTISEKGQVLVSQRVIGASALAPTLLKHHGNHLRPPQEPAHRPLVEHIRWHTREVFKSPHRPLT